MLFSQRILILRDGRTHEKMELQPAGSGGSR